MQSSKASIVFFNTNYKQSSSPPSLPPLSYNLATSTILQRDLKYKWHAYKRIPMELQFFCLIELLASRWKYCRGHAQCICKPNHKLDSHATYVHTYTVANCYAHQLSLFFVYLSQESVTIYTIYIDSNKMHL
jgi:hypothetical protein